MDATDKSCDLIGGHPDAASDAAMSEAARHVVYLTRDLPGVGGVIKVSPRDFEVEEIPAYPPAGEGEHLFLWIEKEGVSAEQLTRHVARVLNISFRDIGMAGLKDKQALTRQFISVPARTEARVPELNCETIRVLDAKRHRNKLRTGHLKGNRFRVLVRQVTEEALQRSNVIAERVAARGFPNYYGDQRFGTDGETLRTGIGLLRGDLTSANIPHSRRHFLLRLSLSAVQSFLFNRYLSDRLSDNLLHTVLIGDVMQRVISGGLFVVEDRDGEQARFDASETVVTGPMFGPKMTNPAGEALRRESRLLERYGLSHDSFSRFPRLTSGTRRPLVIWPDDLSLDPEPDGLSFQFTLPPGAYATSLLREFMKTDADERR